MDNREGKEGENWRIEGGGGGTFSEAMVLRLSYQLAAREKVTWKDECKMPFIDLQTVTGTQIKFQVSHLVLSYS